MLNPAFPYKKNDSNYVLKELLEISITKNRDFKTEEKRFNGVFSYEVWKKIKRLGLTEADFENKTILDLCAGSGFLSFHLLKKIKPKKITLWDISENEINNAKDILSKKYKDVSVEYKISDFLRENSSSKYDVIIGNSFLHHFYNIPEALNKINFFLKPNGLFISLHEPTIASTAFESRNPKLLFYYLTRGKKYIEIVRKKWSKDIGSSSDVWIFPKKEYVNLLKNIWPDTKTVNWGLLRPIVISYGSFLPDKYFYFLKKYLFKLSIFLDSILNMFLPNCFFSSVSSFSIKK